MNSVYLNTSNSNVYAYEITFTFYFPHTLYYFILSNLKPIYADLLIDMFLIQS